MRITILTAGSRGDVQPYVALGLGMQKEGYTIRLATHANFEPMIRERGLEFDRLEGDPQAIVRGETGLEWLESGRNPFGFIRGFRRLMIPVMRQAFEDAWAACPSGPSSSNQRPMIGCSRAWVPSFTTVVRGLPLRRCERACHRS